ARTLSGNHGDRRPLLGRALGWTMRRAPSSAAVRPAIIAAALALTSVLAAILTIEAVSASRHHRLTAERALRNYSALGAEGAAQRLKAALNNRFTTVLLAAAAERGPVTAAELRSRLPSPARDLLDESSRVMRITHGDTLAPTLATATASLPGFAYFGMKWVE